jgi:hypothetical protein
MVAFLTQLLLAIRPRFTSRARLEAEKDHLVVFDEAQLRRVLRNCASYYNQVRTHLSLGKHAPDFQRPQKIGRIAAIPILGGLHHQYVRV